MKRALLGLVLLLLSQATASSGHAPASALPHVVDGDEHSAFPWIGFNVSADQITVEVPSASQAYHDVVVMIGAENATEPREWYVVHFGADMLAVDRDGQTLDVANGTFARSGGDGGDCVVVAGEQWDRIDHEKRVLARVPAALPSLMGAWGAGEHCYQEVIAPPVVTQAKKTPLGFLIPTIALIAVAVLRRP